MQEDDTMPHAPTVRRRPAIGLAAAIAAAVLGAPGAATAHHGWSWAEGEQTELRGTVREVYVGHPHPTLRVEAADGGGVWLVELANPRQTERSGFTAASAAPGDAVVALGNRSRAEGERRMNAVRLTVRGRSYDLYPERIRGG
jgi:hypothetical protein